MRTPNTNDDGFWTGLSLGILNDKRPNNWRDGLPPVRYVPRRKARLRMKDAVPLKSQSPSPSEA